MAERPPLTETQWRSFRAHLEELAEHAALYPHVSRSEMTACLLLLCDKLDDLEKRLSA